MPESSVVTYRGRRIDLRPYLEGFPYAGFHALDEADLLLYFHDLPDRRVLKVQPLAAPFDPAIGRQVSDVDWNRRSFWSPIYERARRALLFIGDQSNDEVFNVYRLGLDDGALEQITDVPYVNAFEPSPDQRRLAYVARYADGPVMRAELRLRDLTSGEDRAVVADTPSLRLTWGHILWRGDTHLLVAVNVEDDRNRKNLAWVDLAAPRLAPLLDTAPRRSVLGVEDEWLDERTGLVVSNESGFTQLYRLDVTTGATARLTDEPYDYRAVATVRADGRPLVATVVDRPQDSPMRLLDPATGATLWEHVAPGSVFLLDAGQRSLHAVSTSLEEKWALWRLDVAGGVRWQKIAGMPEEVARATSHAVVERIDYPTFDVDPKTGRTRLIHAFLLVPRDLPPPGERRAFVQAFYGGHNTYSQNDQILAQAGFIVLSPAVRGSSGFGADFYGLIDKDLGGDEMIDLVYGARYLVERFGLAPRHIGVFGGSHGGYATLRALTLPTPINHAPSHGASRDESIDWGFGWSHAGFYDIATFWRDCNIPDWVTQKAGDPRTEADKLRDRSPIAHAARLRAPVYLTHGDRDNRVPVGESRRFVERLRELGKEYAYDEFAGHGHGLKGIAAQRRLWSGLLGYLERAGV